MRIATWNVNSLKARLDKVTWWLTRAKPEVLLMQETKLADADAPTAVFRDAGFELAHHGEGRWNGVAIASRVGIADIVTNFGEPLRPRGHARRGRRRAARGSADDLGRLRRPARDQPLRAERARRGLALLRGQARLVRPLRPLARPDPEPGEALVVGGDFNVAPADADVWDPQACHGGTHVSEPERAAFARLCQWGLIDAYRLHHPESGRYTWWDYRAGNFHKNFGMRIDHLLVSDAVAKRTVGAEIDREARKGKPIPSDHAPLAIDLDEPGHAFDAGWTAAEGRIAGRLGPARDRASSS